MSIVMVIGAASFVGQWLIPELAKIHEKIIGVYHNTKPEYRQNNVILVKGDVTDYESLSNIIKEYRPSIIYNLSGLLSRDCLNNPLLCVRTNALGAANVLELARKYDVSFTVHISSVAVFRRGLPEPATDDSPLLLPLDPYGATKIFIDSLTNIYFNTYGMKCVTLRYGWIFGPGRRTGGTAFANELIEKALKGEPVKVPRLTGNWIYIKDVVRSLVEIPTKNIKRSTYIIGGENKSTEEVVNILREFVPNIQVEFIEFGKYDPPYLWVSTMDDIAARVELGWKPQYDIRTAIRDYINYLKNEMI